MSVQAPKSASPSRMRRRIVLRAMSVMSPMMHLARGPRFGGGGSDRAAAPRTRRWAAPVRVLPVDRADEADDYRSISDRDELERAFRHLPLDQRAVFILHHHVGLPLVAVAEALGIPGSHGGPIRCRTVSGSRPWPSSPSSPWASSP